MKIFKLHFSGLHINLIDRDLLLVLLSAAGIALALGTLVVMAVSRL